MLYRRQWLTYAFQSVITTGINIHVQEPDWSFFTNWSSPSLQPARVLGHHGRLWNQQHSEYPIINFYYGNVPLYPCPGYNTNRGRVVVPPRRTWRPVLQAWWPKQGEQAKGARLRVSVEFNLSFFCKLKGRSSNVCLSCIGQFLLRSQLIYWPACLILVCMYFNKHFGSFKKKSIRTISASSASAHQQGWCIRKIRIGLNMKIEPKILTEFG